MAGCAEREQQITGLAKRLQLACENRIEAVVVADGGQRRGVGGQGDPGEPAAFAFEPACQFSGEMLGVGCRAAIAAGEHASTPAQRLGDGLGRTQDFGRHGAHGLECGAVFGEALLDQ